MEFPRGHHHHLHHRRDDDDDDNDADRYPPPTGRPAADDYDFPPPPFGRPADDFPPPSHHRPPPPSNYYEPSPPYSSVNAPPAYNTYDSAPPQTSVHHVYHDPEIPQPEPHHHRPHLPSFHREEKRPEPSSEISSKPAVRVFTKAEADYSLTIREGQVILAPSNPSDPYQQWVKDEKYSTKVKDEEGFPCFSLVNKATGEALKHSIGATQPVQLTPYNPNVLDESVLWTLSRDLGDSYRTIRMVNNIKLNVDAFNGDKNHGGVHDGTTIVLWEWKKGDNQRWKIVAY